MQRLLLLLLPLLVAAAAGSSIMRPTTDHDPPRLVAPAHPSQSDESQHYGGGSASGFADGAVMPIKSRGSFLGDFCTEQCNAGLQHTVCDPISLRCECEEKFPVVVDNNICAPSLKLGDPCLYDQSCQYFDRNAVCAQKEDSDVQICQCRPKYEPSVTLESVLADSICIPEPHGPWLKSDVPTVIGLGVGMSIFMGLICLVLKLFSRARFAEARGYGNAHLPPPVTASSANHSDGKHRQSYHRQMSVTESEGEGGGQQPRRNNSITTNGGGYHHSRAPGSFHGGRRPSSSQSSDANRATRGQHQKETAQQEADPAASSPEHLEQP